MRKVYYLTNHLMQRWLPVIWLTGLLTWLAVQITVSRAINANLIEDLPLYIRYEQILSQSGVVYAPAILLAVFLALLVWLTGRDIKTRALYTYYQLPVSNLLHLFCRLLAALIALTQLTAMYLFSVWSAYYLFFYPDAKTAGIRQPLLLTWLRADILRLIIPARHESIRQLLLVIILLMTAAICLTFEYHVRSAASMRKKQLIAIVLLAGLTMTATKVLQTMFQYTEPLSPLLFTVITLLATALIAWRAWILLANRRIEP